jgi:OHCU decarboxylase
MTIEDVNGSDLPGFINAVGWVFEHSPWVAERAWASRPFKSLGALHDALTSQVTVATHDEQLALLRAHPDLGGRAKMSEASTVEQADAGLDRLTPAEFARLTTLNSAYREKFGFPFLYAVKGGSKQDILTALERRLLASPDVELGEALRQVDRIAQFRLEEVFR